MSDTSTRLPLTHRLPFVRDLVHDFEGNIYYFLLIVLTLVVLAVKTWGLVALGLLGVSLTPVMFVIILLITLGK